MPKLKEYLSGIFGRIPRKLLENLDHFRVNGLGMFHVVLAEEVVRERHVASKVITKYTRLWIRLLNEISLRYRLEDKPSCRSQPSNVLLRHRAGSRIPRFCHKTRFNSFNRR